MKPLISSLIAAFALLATPSTAAPITFTYTGSIAEYAAPITGQYRIVAVGARGGSVRDQGGIGGLGAEAGGSFFLVQGELLSILVGEAGADDPFISRGFESFAGGGGGSFVVAPGNVPLVVAGGGGGGGQLNAFYPSALQPVRGGARYNGGDAQTATSGGASQVAQDPSQQGGVGGVGGADGQGGSFGPGRSIVNAGRGFNSFPSFLGPGAFGGGGLASDVAGGGGGGGFSGGGGGGQAALIGTFRYGIGGGGGGGGGSFSAAANPFLQARVGTTDGSVTITPLSEPVREPLSVALLAVGVLALRVLHRSATVPS